MSIHSAHRDFLEVCQSIILISTLIYIFFTIFFSSFTQAEAASQLSKEQRKEKYISAAKNYLLVAKNIDDKVTRASILYLSTLAANKAELVSSTSHVSIAHIPTIDDSIAPISSTGGRLNTFSPPMQPLEDMKKHAEQRNHPSSSSSSGSSEVVADLLVLEARLNELGKQRFTIPPYISDYFCSIFFNLYLVLLSRSHESPPAEEKRGRGTVELYSGSTSESIFR